MVVLVHTEVATEFEGHGVGSRLAAAALDDIRARGLKVDPVCPFIARYLDRHPELSDLVATESPSPGREWGRCTGSGEQERPGFLGRALELGK